MGHASGRVGVTDRDGLLHYSNGCTRRLKRTHTVAIRVKLLETGEKKTRAREKALGAYFL